MSDHKELKCHPTPGMQCHFVLKPSPDAIAAGVVSAEIIYNALLWSAVGP